MNHYEAVVPGLEADATLRAFLEREALPGTGVVPEQFWSGLERIVSRLAPRNDALLGQRDDLQARLDEWYRRARAGHESGSHIEFLRLIGYLEPEPQDFEIDTAQVDVEIADIAGPQLVVPVTNARYALNAANARWGSLYDALYGTDALAPAPAPDAHYDAQRGAQVIAYCRGLLDRCFPLTAGTWTQAHGFAVPGGQLAISLQSGASASLRAPDQFVGYTGEPASPASLLLRHHGLHVELRLDREHPIGRVDPAGVCDVLLEAAVTTIQDLEDSVACVDAEDKVLAYRNWLGLLTGRLTAGFVKSGIAVERRLNPDRRYFAPDGRAERLLPGRSLMLVRNVGPHMMTDCVRVRGKPIPESFLDALVTSAIALHDLRGTGPYRNSRTGSIYIVKPKLHGSAEVALTDELFAQVEDVLSLPRYAVKIGIMDEERRTSFNLKACIRAARHRVAFINTGFLDRTGDEIHSTMEAGPVVRKGAIKDTRWIHAYEQRNVDVGLACGLPGRAQIGKGMWAMPDQMHAMLQSKGAHPAAGANTAWVPSPSAATLHALHYHEVDVHAVQRSLVGRPPAPIEDLLTPPTSKQHYSAAEIDEELRNNAQGILGYTVRWIDQGVGCSKIPDLAGIGLMEDRATLRISSQHIANWLRHGVCSRQQVIAVLQRMAAVVDAQNAGDPAYIPMAPDFERSIAFRAACDLVFHGCERPNGYVESVLQAARRQRKAAGTGG